MKDKTKQSEGYTSDSVLKKCNKKGPKLSWGAKGVDKNLASLNADEIDDLLNDNGANQTSSITKSKLLELNSTLNHYLPPPVLPNYHKKFPKIRIEENSPIQTTNTITNTSLKAMKWDICKESPLKNNHIILCEVWLVPVHCDWYKKDLLSLDIKKFETVQGWTAKLLGNKKSNATIVTRGWKCQRWEHLVDKKLKEDAISCEFCKGVVGCIVNSKLESKSIWVHIQWVFWHPYTAYVSLEDKEEIESDENKFKLESSAIRSKWIFWKVDNLITLTCDINDWDNSFCIRCASNKNMITDIEDMRSQRIPENEQCCLIFCMEHIKKGRDAIKAGDYSVFRDSYFGGDEGNSQTDKENQQPLDFVIKKIDSKERTPNDKEEFKQPDKVLSKLKKGKSIMQKRPYNKKAVLGSKDKPPKGKLDEISKTTEESTQKHDCKDNLDTDKKTQNVEESKQYKIKTRNQLRAENKEKTQLESSNAKIDNNEDAEPTDMLNSTHSEQKIDSSVGCNKSNQSEEEEYISDVRTSNSMNKGRLSDRNIYESAVSKDCTSDKIDSLLNSVNSISEKVEMQRQFCVVLHALFDKLNQDLGNFTSKQYLGKADITELKEWMLDRFLNDGEKSHNLQLKKREIKELEKEQSQNLINSTQFSSFQPSQQLGFNHYLYQNAKGLLSQCKLLEQTSLDPEKERYKVTPKLWQILNWPYNSSNKMNEYPYKFISDELIKYFTKQGLVSNSLIDISKDNEFKMLGYKGIIQTNQIIEAIREMGLIERVIE